MNKTQFLAKLANEATDTTVGGVLTNDGTGNIRSTLPTSSFASLTGLPTTIAGYGITDAVSLDSPAFTGAPTAPTAPSGTNTTQLATTAFVQANSGSSIMNVTASVASNALTIGLGATGISFRSATNTIGVPTFVTTGALSLVVPNTATLGTINATPARLVILALNVAGVIHLGVTNLAGGRNLDETDKITTAVLNTASDVAATVYSDAVYTQVPYRVLGFIDIQEAVAGTWTSAPTKVQGIGGQALAGMSTLGFGQTWQVVSRTAGTTYYNTTGRPIMVNIVVSSPTAVDVYATAILSVSGNVVSENTCTARGSSVWASADAIVPPGASYIPNWAGAATAAVYELR